VVVKVAMRKLALDLGHGGSKDGSLGFDPGAIGVGGIRECDLTTLWGNELHQKLISEYEVEVAIMPRINGTRGQRLVARTDATNAWGADLLLSIHFNAFDGDATGYEDFIYNGHWPTKYQTVDMQRTLHDKVAAVFKRWGLPDRGAKEANLHMVRESNMPAILVELGFIDNPKDAAEVRDATFRKEVIEAIAEGIAEIMDLKKRGKSPGKETGKLYRVQVGAFSSRENAERMAQKLEQCGFEALIKEESK
jgi:N-acetylmuramoyl-L-alanine amidase